MVEDVLGSSGAVTLSAAQKEVVGNNPRFVNALKSTKLRVDNGMGRRSRKRAEAAKAARTPEWHETPWGDDQ